MGNLMSRTLMGEDYRVLSLIIPCILQTFGRVLRTVGTSSLRTELIATAEKAYLGEVLLN
jgi:hypothetical protein